jgi:GNAT superfamily N-acetyltransferase
MTALVVERRRREDAEEIFRLYQDVFGERLTEGSRRRWRWQYLDNPVQDGADPAIWVARDGAQVLGQYASMPVRLHWGGREVRSSWGMDVFLRPEARGRGLGATLFTTWSDHVEVALGMGLTPSSYGLFQKLAYNDVGPVPFYRLVLDAGAVTRRRLGAIPGALAAPFVAVALALVQHARPLPTDVAVQRITSFSPEFDALWEAAGPGWTMCVRRDAAYLGWKYVQGPQPYDLWEARRDGRLTGYAVSRHEDLRGVRLGWMVDAFAARDDDETRDALLGAVLADFRAARVARAQAFAMSAPLQAALRRRGFRPGRSPMQFCVRSRVGDTPFQDRGGWHVVFGDSDMDR